MMNCWFNDAITITNSSNSTIKISTLIVEARPFDEYDGKVQFRTFFMNDKEKSIKHTSYNPTWLERDLATNGKMFNKEIKICDRSVDEKVFPIIIKPNEHKKVYFGIRGIGNGKSLLKTQIVIYPKYNYKKVSLRYNIAFDNKMFSK
ncbi:MAG: hypothetical protein PHU12_00650 [Candidatus Aenigmarchaeota archaeon]|nr:hypothetical protein [Candidatus Aenigmarchaeota archaeon]